MLFKTGVFSTQSRSDFGGSRSPAPPEASHAAFHRARPYGFASRRSARRSRWGTWSRRDVNPGQAGWPRRAIVRQVPPPLPETNTLRKWVATAISRARAGFCAM